MNFFTIVEILGFGGLDLTTVSEEMRSLSFMKDDRLEKCEEVEEHTLYELITNPKRRFNELRHGATLPGRKWLWVMGNGGSG
ncbi:hypothetical protein D8674_027616 [Pyrus ussuriensis x Pyrus communis]|uniref:Uncharacterized protein n=1 Tax=Pyrus ussuriensis x Pyrus communis TaxID=2448454 RepID=A0A5N5IF31_9ROSA|nr:hypothetical protein D8674_027616 [Pyrus ussuriensis x Pyrus communis]